MKPELKRSSRWINPSFQSQMLGLMLGICATTLILFYLADFYFFWRLEQHAIAVGMKNGNVFFDFVDEQRKGKLWFFGIAGLIDASLIFYWGLSFSHRVAGPLHRLRVSLLELADRKASKTKARKITFREGDFFFELADAYNDVVKSIEETETEESASEPSIATLSEPSQLNQPHLKPIKKKVA